MGVPWNRAQGTESVVYTSEQVKAHSCAPKIDQRSSGRRDLFCPLLLCFSFKLKAFKTGSHGGSCVWEMFYVMNSI